MRQHVSDNTESKRFMGDFLISRPRPQAPIPREEVKQPALANKLADPAESSEESSEEITLQYIIGEKPRTKVVREFFRANLNAIKSEEQELFEPPMEVSS